MQRSEFMKLAASLLWDGKTKRNNLNRSISLCDAIRHVGRLAGKKDMARRLENELKARIAPHPSLTAWMVAQRRDLPAPTPQQAQKHRQMWADILVNEFAAKERR